MSQTLIEDALHELNRRAGALVAEASLLQDSLGEVTGEALRPAELLIQDVDRLRLFLHRLAALLRAKSSNAEISTDFDVVELAHEIRARERRRGTIGVDGPARAIASGPRASVEQALDILVDNALRYGGGAAHLLVEPDGDLVRVTVADEGPGLPEALRADPFAPFAAARVGLAREGSGLGLALAHALLASTGATLAYRSIGPGAIFSFSLSK